LAILQNAYVNVAGGRLDDNTFLYTSFNQYTFDLVH